MFKKTSWRLLAALLLLSMVIGCASTSPRETSSSGAIERPAGVASCH